MNKVIICLDAGHGGKDSGATLGKRTEKNDVLKLVLRIGKILESNYKNVEIKYTRTTDIYETVSKKALDSNVFKADYFFSFHRNAYNGKAYGFETEFKSHSRIKDAIMKEIKDGMVELGFAPRPDKQRDNLAVLNQTEAPALLFENGFIDNKSDNKIFDKQFDKIVDLYVKVIAKNCNLIKIKEDNVKHNPIIVKKSSSKSDIKWLQKKLNKLYIGTIPDLVVDGIWGKKTLKMLRGYWKQLGWRTTGTYAGKKTCEALTKGRRR